MSAPSAIRCGCCPTAISASPAVASRPLDAKLTPGEEDVWVGKAVWGDRDDYILALERGVTDPRVANRMNACVAEQLDPEFKYIDTH